MVVERLREKGDAYMNKGNRRVTLRDENSKGGSRHLWAYLDDEGNLHIDGQDIGPGTAIVSSDGEYEWFSTISAVDLPRLRTLLHAPPGTDILDVLRRRYSGRAAGDLERLLQGSDIEVKRHVWSG